MTKDNQEQPDTSHTQPSTPQIICNIILHFISMLKILLVLNVL